MSTLVRNLRSILALAVILFVIWLIATPVLRYQQTRGFLREGPTDGIHVRQGPLWPAWLWRPLGEEWTKAIPPIVAVDVARKGLREHDDWPERIGRISTMTRLSADFNAMSESEIVRLLEARPEALSDLSIRHSDFGDRVLVAIAGLDSLKRLHADGTLVTKEGLERLRRERPDLKIDVDRMTSYGLGKLTRGATVDIDERTHRIVGLNLRHDATAADAASLAILPGPLWVRIELQRADLYEELARLPNVRRIDMSGFRNRTIAPEAFDLLADSTSLHELTLNRSAITDDHLPHIAKIRSLRGVDLFDTQVTADGLKRLEALRPDLDVRPASLEATRSGRPLWSPISRRTGNAE